MTDGDDAGDALRLEAVELHRVSLPLVRPFRTSFGTQTVRDVVLVRVLTDRAEGWGELVTTAAPVYSSEFTDGAVQVLREHLVPRLPHGGLTARRLHDALAGVRGHRMAVAALEMAVLDAELRATARSFAEAFGGVRDRVDCGVSVGIPDGGVPALVRLTTEKEGRARGAGFGHPEDGLDVLAGRPCRRIIYDHHDGPFASRTIAYVLPVGDRFLGLEFRSTGPLDPVQRRMLASFRLP